MNLASLPFLLSMIAWSGTAQIITSQPRPVIKFGPLALAWYKDVGSQEVIFVELPPHYLPFFAFEWSVGITTTDGSSAVSCPHAMALMLARRRGIPIPNPYSANVPSNTWDIDLDTFGENFEISKVLPEQDKHSMMFNDTVNSTGEYYVSTFLISHGAVAEIPDKCKYVMQLSVTSYDDISAMDEVRQFQPISAGLSHESGFYLERYRDGLLSTNFVTAKEGYNVSMNSSTIFSWMVQPYADTGGTLKITLGFNSTDSFNGTTVIEGCATWMPYIASSWDHCHAGQSISVNNSMQNSKTWYWPFPKSGLWTLDIVVKCVEGTCGAEHNINVHVNIVQCIDSCHSDRHRGECKMYRTDVVLFSACNCKGGWQGIACTDGSKAVPHSRQLLVILLLTLSNLVFFPCGVLAVIKKYYSESVVYFFVMFFSTFYHACDSKFSVALCILPYNTLQYSDFYGSITAMWVTLIAVAKLPFRLESFFHVSGIMAIGVAVTYNRFSVMTTLVPVLCALLILAIKWGRECKASHGCYPSKKDWAFSIIPGALCAMVGCILFTIVETSENYFYIHSIWHVLMGSAVLFLIPKEKKCWGHDDDGAPIFDTSYIGIDTDDVHDR